MQNAYICDAIRTPIGKYGGSLSSIRPDDLLAHVFKILIERNNSIDLANLDDVIIGCANQAGEDNRNVARMALLISGIPHTVPAVTVNRLCGSGMEAVGYAARAIKTGEANLIIAGGVESMSRAPYVLEKPSEPFSRNMKMYDTTLGWRFVNPIIQKKYGTESMIETAENIAQEFNICREDQDKFALWSQEKAKISQENGLFKDEIIPVEINNKEKIIIEVDEHPRNTTLEKLSSLKPILRQDGTVTAGNSSGINDGASALIVASENAIMKYNLKPLAKILGMDVVGVEPRLMGLGPVPATKKLLKRFNIKLEDIDIIELNEAFASQALCCIREIGLNDFDERINPMGGAIALGHPLGMTGARLVTTAVHQLRRKNLNKALCTMCIGVGQGIAMILENVS